MWALPPCRIKSLLEVSHARCTPIFAYTLLNASANCKIVRLVNWNRCIQVFMHTPLGPWANHYTFLWKNRAEHRRLPYRKNPPHPSRNVRLCGMSHCVCAHDVPCTPWWDIMGTNWMRIYIEKCGGQPIEKLAFYLFFKNMVPLHSYFFLSDGRLNQHMVETEALTSTRAVV